MTDEIIQEIEPDVRRMLDEEPPSGGGLWKLTSQEIENLSLWLTQFIHKSFNSGWDQGYDSCLDHLTEGIAIYMETGTEMGRGKESF